MENLARTTLTSMETAQMVGKEHSKLLKDIRRYSEQLNEAKIGLVDFFKESTYVDGKGESRPCYEITKKGCEFIAHKLTGQKGTEFTARYINRFHEMENQTRQIPITEHPGEVANLIKQTSRLMERQGIDAYKVAQNAEMICGQFGIVLSPEFVKIPEFHQMSLFADE